MTVMYIIRTSFEKPEYIGMPCVVKKEYLEISLLHKSIIMTEECQPEVTIVWGNWCYNRTFTTFWVPKGHLHEL